jgi:hypothetical protein
MSNTGTTTSWRNVLRVHPACEVFPSPLPDELLALGEDIKQNRLRERVKVIRDGDGYAVLDGRSRLDAMEAVGLSVTIFDAPGRRLIDRGGPNSQFFEVVDLDIDPFDFVMSANARRRHMTSKQKRDVAAKLLQRFPERPNLAIAKMIGIDDKTVASVRREMEGHSEIPNGGKITDTLGRRRSARRQSHPRQPAATATVSPEPQSGSIPQPKPPPAASVPVPTPSTPAPSQPDMFKPAPLPNAALGAASAAPNTQQQWEFSLLGFADDAQRMIDKWDAEFPGWRTFPKTQIIINNAAMAAAVWAIIVEIVTEGIDAAG